MGEFKNKIKGIGIDLCENKKFLKMPFEKNKSFYNKIFTKKEIQYCLSKNRPAEHFSARFAAKEAFIKANNLKIKDLKAIEILNNKSGKPKISYSNKTIIQKYYISLTHTETMSAAIVILC